MTDAQPPRPAAGLGRGVATIYLLVCAATLVWMVVETLLGRAGIGTMFAAFLGVPWSMLVANFVPLLPANLPMAAGIAIRVALLALFMLLNAAIIRGITARAAANAVR
jgi:hypothetical protein